MSDEKKKKNLIAPQSPILKHKVKKIALPWIFSGRNGSTCPSLLFPRPSSSGQPTVGDAQKQKHDDANKRIAVFFFHNSIPFGAAKSMYYQDMVNAIADIRRPRHQSVFGTGDD